MSTPSKKRGLGRGLDALFQDTPAGTVTSVTADQKQKTFTLPVGQLQPGQYQPRRHFDDEALNQLAESIKTHGVLQPLLVRPVDGDMYEIIAGERRWRASQKAQLHDVPVIIQDLSDDVVLEIALIENLQRENLSPLEEADGYQRLIEEFDYTQQKLAEKLGKSRSHIANTLRLLKLPEKVKPFVDDGRLSAGHARAVLTAKDPSAFAHHVVREGLSVREAEKQALTFGTDIGTDAKARQSRDQNMSKDVDTLALEKELSSLLGMRTVIAPTSDGAGKITFQYKNLDQLDMLIKKLTF